MNPQSLLMALLWLAALGGVVIVATRVVGKVGAKAASAV
jgi:hypothetical protein